MELLTLEQIRERNYKLPLSGLEIKPYLPLAAKQIIVERILSICKIDASGLIKIDFALKEFAREFTLVNQYSNLNCEVEDIVSLYDELKEYGVIDYILNQVPESEINFINHVLDQEIRQIQKVDNSVEMVLSKGLIKLLNKLPDEKGMSKLLKSLPKEINKINPENLQYITKAIGWNNGVLKEN